jgi:hypothetical protein
VRRRILLLAATVLLGVIILLWFPSSTDGPGESEAPSLEAIRNEPEAYQDRFFVIPGYGLIMAEIPLCPGYVGLDRRVRFVDRSEATVIAHAPQPFGDLYHTGMLRNFRVVVRIFQGEIGCPGETTVETMPYLEVIDVEK